MKLRSKGDNWVLVHGHIDVQVNLRANSAVEDGHDGNISGEIFIFIIALIETSFEQLCQIELQQYKWDEDNQHEGKLRLICLNKKFTFYWFQG